MRPNKLYYRILQIMAIEILHNTLQCYICFVFDFFSEVLLKFFLLLWYVVPNTLRLNWSVNWRSEDSAISSVAKANILFYQLIKCDWLRTWNSLFSLVPEYARSQQNTSIKTIPGFIINFRRSRFLLKFELILKTSNVILFWWFIFQLSLFNLFSKE